jgi:hypothetical protein
MPKNKVSEWSTTAASNTDIGGININEGCPPSGINNAIRELMAQVRDFQLGADGDGLTVSTLNATTATIGTISGTTMTLSGDISAANLYLSTSIIHEGTADDFETTLAFTDPTEDRTITIPDDTGTVALTSQLPTSALVYLKSGTYAIPGTTTLTVTSVAHGLQVNDQVYLNFTSGDAVDGNYVVQTVPTDDTFTITHGTAITSSGNVSGYYSTLGLVVLSSNDEAIVGTSTAKVPTVSGVTAYVTNYVSSQFVLSTAIETTSATSFTFTDIPSWVKRITVILNAVSTVGSTGLMQIQLGDSGGIETTGYVTVSASSGGTSTSTSGFVIRQSDSSGDAITGQMIFTKISGNTWISSHSLMASGDNTGVYGGGRKTLSDTLTQLRLTTILATGNFDAGSINILYE